MYIYFFYYYYYFFFWLFPSVFPTWSTFPTHVIAVLVLAGRAHHFVYRFPSLTPLAGISHMAEQVGFMA